MWVAQRRRGEQIAVSAWNASGDPVVILVAVSSIDRERGTVRIAVDAPAEIKLERLEAAKNASDNNGDRSNGRVDLR